jgi:hypothetical protein
MPIYRLTKDSLELLRETSFSQQRIKERDDLQRVLRTNIGIIAPDVLVIAEEFGEWEGSRRRIDLLGVDRRANLVVIELKRDEEGAHMELQAIRYAAMVSQMTFERAVEVFQAFLDSLGDERDARDVLLEFLGWDEPREEEFGQDVRMVLASADFSKELTTAVLWLNERDLDIQCVRLKPYDSPEGLLIDAQKLIPLPEAADYQEGVRRKAGERREARRHDTGYWFMNVGEYPKGRSWEDCRKYGFMSAGGGPKWVAAVHRLPVGTKLFAYLSRHGYVGLGEVTAAAVPYRDFVPPGETKTLLELPLVGKVDPTIQDDPEKRDECVAIRWIKTLDRSEAVLASRALRGTVARIGQPDLVAELLRLFGTVDGSR